MDDLIAATVHAAVTVAPGVLDDVASTISAHGRPGFALRSHLAADLPRAASDALGPLLDAWASPEVHGGSSPPRSALPPAPPRGCATSSRWR
ncbi:MAG: hypothetical protein M3N52_04540 [Actinomycetota bacterium]|nr:hypothetical protein [Actinomycetota bacterium]